MIVLVAGSRSWRDYQAIRSRLEELRPELVMHGGARGADEIAGRVCEQLAIPQHVLRPLWAVHGKRAGFVRTDALLAGQPDLVLAFWDGESPGTAYTIKQANKLGIEVEVHGWEDEHDELRLDAQARSEEWHE